MSCRAAEEAVLLTCDVPMIRFIRHIDQERSRETNLGSFVLRTLDETHLYVRPDVVQMLREKIKELQASNTFKNIERGAAGSEAVADAADAPSSKPPAKRRKVQDTASAASGSTTIRLPALPGGAAAAGAAAAEAPRNFVPGFRGDG